MAGMSPEEVVELKHSLKGMAELLWSYFKELRNQGFDKQEALAITIGWQRAILSQGQGKSDE